MVWRCAQRTLGGASDALWCYEGARHVAVLGRSTGQCSGGTCARTGRASCALAQLQAALLQNLHAAPLHGVTLCPCSVPRCAPVRHYTAPICSLMLHPAQPHAAPQRSAALCPSPVPLSAPSPTAAPLHSLTLHHKAAPHCTAAQA